MTDLDLLVRFEDGALVGLSPRTVRDRQATLLRFAQHMAPRPLLEATSGTIDAWITDDPTIRTARARSGRLTDLGSFYVWAFNSELIDHDPTATLFHGRRTLTAGDFPELERGWWIAMERKGLKRSSIESRAQILRRFYDWLAPRSIVDATTEDVELWLDSRKIGSKARYTSISNVHMFYRWAQKEGLVNDDPTSNIDRPRVAQTVPRPISDANLALALDRADTVTRAILAAAAFEGMRAGEIAGLQREDILEHLDAPMLIVSKPKGHRERTLPLHPEAWKALQPVLPRSGPVFRWTEERLPNGRQKTTIPCGRPWPSWKVSQVANTHLADLGIPSSLHKLRSWFATKVYAASLDLRLTQELLGHSSPTTTAIYAAYNKAAATETVAKLRIAQ